MRSAWDDLLAVGMWKRQAGFAGMVDLSSAPDAAVDSRGRYEHTTTSVSKCLL